MGGNYCAKHAFHGYWDGSSTGRGEIMFSSVKKTYSTLGSERMHKVNWWGVGGGTE
jgi:hypothetical protein